MGDSGGGVEREDEASAGGLSVGLYIGFNCDEDIKALPFAEDLAIAYAFNG